MLQLAFPGFRPVAVRAKPSSAKAIASRLARDVLKAARLGKDAAGEYLDLLAGSVREISRAFEDAAETEPVADEPRAQVEPHSTFAFDQGVAWEVIPAIGYVEAHLCGCDDLARKPMPLGARDLDDVQRVIRERGEEYRTIILAQLAGTGQEKRKILCRVLRDELWSSKSDSEIAAVFNLSRRVVREAREEVGAVGGPRVARRGNKLYPMTMQKLVQPRKAKAEAAPAEPGLAAVFGKWPGDETDEEIAAALKDL